MRRDVDAYRHVRPFLGVVSIEDPAVKHSRHVLDHTGIVGRRNSAALYAEPVRDGFTQSFAGFGSRASSAYLDVGTGEV